MISDAAPFPANTPAPLSGPPIMVSRKSAGNSGTLSNWNPRKVIKSQIPRSREKIVTRALDLEANDPHVSGLIESINVNTVGVGFRAQSKIKVDMTPLPRGMADLLQKSAEWEWELFSKNCDIQKKKQFADICALVDRCMLNRGEYLVVTKMVPRSGRHDLKLMVVDPLRLKTPSDKTTDPHIIDGVHIDKYGAPVGYWIHDCPNKPHQLTSKSFKYIKAFHGHRKIVFHGFHEKSPDQYRGEVFFSPAMKFFKDLSDLLDSEVVSNIITSALALFIETPDPTAAARAAAGGAAPAADGSPQYEDWDAGQVMYGRHGEKPHMLSANRPGDNFVPFIDTVLRAASSCAGIPLEVAAKNYKDMNYSSARAALLEAWRVFSFRQDWLIRHFCAPVWSLLLEECYLKSYIDYPHFYSHREAYSVSKWIVPPKGHIDEVKAVTSSILKLKNNMTTQTKIAAENGMDWQEDIAEERSREQEQEERLGLEYPQTTKTGKDVKNAK